MDRSQQGFIERCPIPVLVLVLLLAWLANAQGLTESQMRAKIEEYTKEALQLCNKNVKAGWDLATDVGNKEKEKHKVSIS